jgi:hypothetical protein
MRRGCLLPEGRWRFSVEALIGLDLGCDRHENGEVAGRHLKPIDCPQNQSPPVHTDGLCLATRFAIQLPNKRRDVEGADQAAAVGKFNAISRNGTKAHQRA